MIKVKYISYFCLVFPALVFAAVPDDLLFNHKPIDALCFFDMQHQTNTINLKKCGLAEYKYSVKGKNTDLIHKGYIGYDWADPAVPAPSHGYSYYRFFEAGDHAYWLYTINSGGGTGEFTSIYWVKRKNATMLEMKQLAAGDRCNGGIQDVSGKNHNLNFSVNLTAYDFLLLAKTHVPTIKAYDDLAACAVCCVAKAYYETTTNAAPALNFIDLGNTKNAEEMPQQGDLQVCFNKLFTSYVASGNNKFTPQNLKEFTVKFQKTCVK
jgi:hypothetical protein